MKIMFLRKFHFAPIENKILRESILPVTVPWPTNRLFDESRLSRVFEEDVNRRRMREGKVVERIEYELRTSLVM